MNDELKPMTFEEWERRITRRVYADGDVTLGELCTLLREMWEDAQELERQG